MVSVRLGMCKCAHVSAWNGLVDSSTPPRGSRKEFLLFVRVCHEGIGMLLFELVVDPVSRPSNGS